MRIYTDAEKIRRLTAWHESEKKEIETLKARITELETGIEEIREQAVDAQGEWACVSEAYLPDDLQTIREIEKIVDRLTAGAEG
jgi:uncharacterized protein YrzB (UPF0473 family)